VCQKPFTPERPEATRGRYEVSLVEQAVLLYIDQGASYRAVARELRRRGVPHLDAKRCWSLIQGVGAGCLSPWELSRQLRPQWSGYLALDGDSLRVGPRRELMLLGVDLETLDVPHLILAEHEDTENWLFFLLVLKHTLGYPFRGIVSDGDPAVEQAVGLVCPGVPHQFCVRYFQDGLHRYLRYQSSHGRGTWREIRRFEDLVHQCIYSSTLQGAARCLAAIKTDAGFRRIHLEDAIRLLERNFSRLTQHFLIPGLPRTTNVIEGLIHRLDRRLNAMDSFANHETTWNILKLLGAQLRFRTLTDCRHPYQHRNGFCPLQLANINTNTLNWIQFSKKTTNLKDHYSPQPQNQGL
jgi:transposase-like protein